MSLPPAARPIQLARAIQYTLSYRSNGSGMSTYEAARYGLREAGIMDYADDWVPVLIGFLDSSPSAAEAWAERQVNASLTRAFGKEG